MWAPETSALNQLSSSVDVEADVVRRFYRVVSGETVIEHLITSPTPGVRIMPSSSAGLRDTDITFTWEVDGVAPDFWWFQVGTEDSRTAYYTTPASSAFPAGQRSHTVSGIPFDGGDIVVSLWSFSSSNEDWVGSAFNYETEALGEIESPAPGGPLAGAGVFQFRANGLTVATWSVFIGSEPGGNEFSMTELMFWQRIEI